MKKKNIFCLILYFLACVGLHAHPGGKAKWSRDHYPDTSCLFLGTRVSPVFSLQS